MSREAEQKLLAYVIERIGPAAVARRLVITEPELDKAATGRSCLSPQQVLDLADLIIELAKPSEASSAPGARPPRRRA